ncbi:GNAT family N-acetyltransferase [Nostoc sp. FACHB-145]|uniref:GNAT family N-acetyltransferase n=1 Tax=Nostoc sp. FACHB-145 TaxID=2692836 RepID=UPI001F54E688|nr:GNAT family N-acetyltransferase [Nostoc sp. FACHB-145]
MNVTNAEQLTNWHYEPPYQMYNSTSNPTLIEYLIDPQNAYYSILEHDELVAFCCFGKSAQVPGGDYQREALDIGLGVRPDLTGQGKGRMYIADVLEFARLTFNLRFLRITVAAFNQRALRAWQKAGFVRVQSFLAQKTQQPFIVLVSHF